MSTNTVITQPKCLLHLLTTDGPNQIFTSYLPNADRKSVHEVNRLSRDAIEKLDFAEKSHLHMLENPSNIVAFNTKGKLKLTTQQAFLTEGGFCNRFFQRVRYYSGYHDLQVKKAIFEREKQILSKMRTLEAECQALQKQEFVNPDEVLSRYRQIVQLESISNNLQESLKLQSVALSKATQKRFCLLRVVLAITQFIVSCFAPRIEHSCDSALKIKENVLRGKEVMIPCKFDQFINGKKRICTETSDWIGYPIGQITEASDKSKASKTLHVYARECFDRKGIKQESGWTRLTNEIELRGHEIVLTNLEPGKDTLASFSIKKTTVVLEEKPVKVIVIRDLSFYTTDSSGNYGVPNESVFDRQLWEKIKTIAMEILMREGNIHLYLEPSYLLVNRSGSGSFVTPVTKALPIIFTKKIRDGKTELLIRDGMFGNYKQLSTTQGLEAQIAKQPILKGQGPILPT